MLSFALQVELQTILTGQAAMETLSSGLSKIQSQADGINRAFTAMSRGLLNVASKIEPVVLEMGILAGSAKMAMNNMRAPDMSHLLTQINQANQSYYQMEQTLRTITEQMVGMKMPVGGMMGAGVGVGGAGSRTRGQNTKSQVQMDRPYADLDNTNFDIRAKNARAFADLRAKNERSLAALENYNFDARRRNTRTLADYDNTDFDMRAKNQRSLAELQNRNFDIQQRRAERVAQAEMRRQALHDPSSQAYKDYIATGVARRQRSRAVTAADPGPVKEPSFLGSMVKGYAGILGIQFGAEAFKGMIHSAAEMQSQMSNLRLMGFSDPQSQGMLATVRQANVRGVSDAEGLTVMRELSTVFGPNTKIDQKTASDILIQAKVLKQFTGEGTVETDARKIIRGTEVSGAGGTVNGKLNQENFREQAMQFTRGVIAGGKNFDADTFKHNLTQASQFLRERNMPMTDELLAQLVVMSNNLGPQAGSAFQNLVSGAQRGMGSGSGQGSALLSADMMKYGLIDPLKISRGGLNPRTGKPVTDLRESLVGYDPAHPENYAGVMRQHIKQTLDRENQAQGKEPATDQEVNTVLDRMLPRVQGRAAGATSSEVGEEQVKAAMDMLARIPKTTPEMLKLTESFNDSVDALDKSFINLGATVGGPLTEQLTKFNYGLANAIGGFKNWAAQNPGTMNAITLGAEGIAGIAVLSSLPFIFGKIASAAAWMGEGLATVAATMLGFGRGAVMGMLLLDTAGMGLAVVLGGLVAPLIALYEGFFNLPPVIKSVVDWIMKLTNTKPGTPQARGSSHANEKEHTAQGDKNYQSYLKNFVGKRPNPFGLDTLEHPINDPEHHSKADVAAVLTPSAPSSKLHLRNMMTQDPESATHTPKSGIGMRNADGSLSPLIPGVNYFPGHPQTGVPTIQPTTPGSLGSPAPSMFSLTGQPVPPTVPGSVEAPRAPDLHVGDIYARSIIIDSKLLAGAGPGGGSGGGSGGGGGANDNAPKLGTPGYQGASGEPDVGAAPPATPGSPAAKDFIGPPIPPELMPKAPRMNFNNMMTPTNGGAATPGSGGGSMPSLNGAPNFKGNMGLHSDAAKQAMQFMQQKGWSKTQSAAIAANMFAESKFNPAAVGDHGQAYGIGQWHPDRQAMFQKLFGHSIRGSSLQEQMMFYDWELHNTEKRAGDHLKSATTIPGAVGAVLESERPANRALEQLNRSGYGNSLMQNFPGNDANQILPMPKSADTSGLMSQNTNPDITNVPPQSQTHVHDIALNMDGELMGRHIFESQLDFSPAASSSQTGYDWRQGAIAPGMSLRA